jgi:hypothetical protein
VDVIARGDRHDVTVTAPSEVGCEDRVDCVAAGCVGDDAVHGAEMLFDVHRQPVPGATIAGVCPKAHRCGCRRVEHLRHDGDERARGDSCGREVGERRLVAGDDDDAAEKLRSIHVRSLHVPA